MRNVKLYIIAILWLASLPLLGQEWERAANYFYFKGPMGGKSILQLASITANGKVEKNGDTDAVIEKDANNKTVFVLTFKEVDIQRSHDIQAYIIIDGKKNKATNINLKSRVVSYSLPAIYVPDQNLHNVVVELVGNANGWATMQIYRKEVKFMAVSQQNTPTIVPKEPNMPSLNPAQVSQRCKADYDALIAKMGANKDISSIDAYLNVTDCNACAKQCVSVKKMRAEILEQAKAQPKEATPISTKGGKTMTLPTLDCQTQWEQINKNNPEDIKTFYRQNCGNGQICEACSEVRRILEVFESQQSVSTVLSPSNRESTPPLSLLLQRPMNVYQHGML